MKKTVFDWRLFWDGFRQLKIMGILFTVLTTGAAVVPPIMQQLDYLSYYLDAGVPLDPSLMGLWDMSPLIVLLFCVFAPLMMLFLFTFVNKRESSDFYHAIPTTRISLFFSFFGAVLAWVLIITVVSTVAATVVHASLPHLFLVNYESIVYTCFNCVAGAVFIMGAVGIAISVTGTVFTNLLVSLILIFFPRILLLLVVQGIQSAFPLVEGLPFAPLLGAEYNVPVGFIFGVFNGELDAPLTQWQSGVYTLVVGLLYTAVACVLFNRRRSEAAGHAAPSRLLQGFYRFLVGLVISSIATFGAFTMCMESYASHWDLTDIGTMVLFYLIALVAAAVFEVLCTRTFRNLFRKMSATLGLLAVANLVLFVGMYGLGRSMFLFRPEAEDIQSVRILSDANGYYSQDMTRPDYFTRSTSLVELTDPEIKEIVAQQLNYSLDLLEISANRYQKEYSNASGTVVAIKSGFVTRYRRILMYTEDMETVASRLKEVEEYRAAYSKLPESVSHINFVSNSVRVGYYKTDDYSPLYTVFREEAKALSFEQWYAVMATNEWYNGQMPLCYLYMQMAEDGKWYSMEVPIYTSLMPQTAEMIINESNLSSHAAAGLDAMLVQPNRLEELHIQYFDTDGQYTGTVLDLTLSGDLKTKVIDWLETLDQANATENIDIDKAFFHIEAYSYYRYDDDIKGEYYDRELNYAFVQDPSGGLPAWLVEYYENAVTSPFDEILDKEKEPVTTATTATSGTY